MKRNFVSMIKFVEDGPVIPVKGCDWDFKKIDCPVYRKCLFMKSISKGVDQK